MKKLVYILGGFGLLFATSCDEPATFDQADSDRRADSIALARTTTESETLYAEYGEACTRQLMVLETTRDSLNSILTTVPAGSGRKTGGTKPSGTTTTPTDNTKPGGLKGQQNEGGGGLKGKTGTDNQGGGGLKGKRN